MKLKDKKVKQIKTDIDSKIKLEYKIIENIPSKDLVLKFQVNVNSLNPAVFKKFFDTISAILDNQKLYMGRTIDLMNEYYIYFNDKPYKAYC